MMMIGNPLGYQRAKAPPLADARPPPPAESAPSEAVDGRRGVDVFGKVADPRRD